MTSPPAPTPDTGATTAATSAVLAADELRVLACLIEKANTTPDQYPLSTNALTAACNQKTSREPVVDYSSALVDRILQLLRDGGWARSIRGTGNRTFKHKHVIEERLGLDVPEQALISVLALRGPQSPGELKTRTERYHPFADLDEVEALLVDLANRQPPLVRDLGRGPGQSQNRWIQLLGPTPGDDAEAGAPAGPAAGSSTVDASAVSAPAGPVGAGVAGGHAAGDQLAAEAAGAQLAAEATDDDVAELRDRVAALEDRLASLERELGLGS